MTPHKSSREWRADLAALRALGRKRGGGALLQDPDGTIFAGLNVAPGRFTGQMHLSQDRGGTWQDAGQLFMADAVHDLLLTPEGTLYVVSGDTYGVIYRTGAFEPQQAQIFLPLVLHARP